VANLVLPDGRILEYAVGGPADGFPLVAHHGTPSGAVLDPALVEAAGRRGLRTILPARAGYDGSTARPGRTVAGVAADVAALLDGLGLDRFVTVGWSGGGPHALACAALLPERCLAAASIAGVAPRAGEGLDWLAGMGAENIEEFGAAAAGEPQLTAYLEAAAPGLAGVQPAEIVAELGDLVSEVDRKALTGAFAENVAESFRASVATGIAGWRDDDLAIVGDWGYRPADIRIPVSIWQGGEDRMVPFDHGRWLAAQLPAATVHLDPAEGHISLVVNKFDAVVAELATRVG
jgi:pimeloyl-ACP methyl ester carboxylesterase